MTNLMPSDERLKLMQNGIVQLDQWLNDIIQVGLLKIDFGYSFDQMISRMVDAKLGGIAKRLSRIKSLDPAKPNWLELVTQELSIIFALTWEFRKIDHLPESRKVALLNKAGFNFRKGDIVKLPGVTDSWLLLGQHKSQEDNLTTRRCWFFGRKLHRTALVLDFAFGRQRLENSYRIGQHYKGKMHYYPALFPMRALLDNPNTANFAVESLPGFADLSRFSTRFAQALCKDPWLGKFPANLKNVTVHHSDGDFFIIDQHRKSIPISNDQETCWRLLALGGGLPTALFGEYNGRSLEVLSLLLDDRIVAV